jgi:hypothetical protein
MSWIDPIWKIHLLPRLASDNWPWLAAGAFFLPFQSPARCVTQNS